MTMNGQLHAPAALPVDKIPPVVHLIVGWLRSIAGLEALGKKHTPYLCRESNADSTVVLPVGL
jgi:hypothetical protein